MRLQIRSKLSIIVGLSIAVVTFIVSTLTIQLQEKELRAQTEVLGTNIVRSLSAVAEDNLLLKTTPILQDYIVKSFSRQRIRGIEKLFVMDRTGRIVAHVESDSVNHLVSREDWDLLVKADSAISVETSTHYRFIQAVYVTKHKKKVLVGGSSVSFSKAALLAPIEEMKWKIILISFFVSIAAISFVYYIMKKVVHIVIVLSDAARRVGEGDLKVSVATRIKDEVGTLTKEFNLMVAQIREKTEMRKFISKSAAQMIKEQKEVTLGGTRNVVTALFTDIRNFTAVSERNEPEEVVETLNHYLDIQTKMIHEHQGVVDKFLGDGIMSIFSGNDMAQNAITAATSIQQQIAQMNKERRAKGEIVLEVGIGIATGIAVLGSIGSHDRMDYTAIGDTINLASRLCSVAEASQILATETVVSRLEGKNTALSVGKMSLKGRQERIPVYRIQYETD